MSIITTKLEIDSETKRENGVASNYKPSDIEKAAIARVIDCFTKGDTTMRKPRREFNDLSVLSRNTIDQMAFNTYQPNNGDPLEGDQTQAWRSNAMRPISRNKVISVAAHATARIIFPKVFAYDLSNDEQQDAALVMESLMEWAGNRANYDKTALYATINALVCPASIIYTDFSDVYRTVKRKKGKDGQWIAEEEIDPESSGFHDEIVPVDELYIENIYEPDIQKQGWLIRRKVISYTLAKAKYLNYDNFSYVQPGMQTIFNDANISFYAVYDNELRGDNVEEIIFWSKEDDVRLVLVNGVLLTDPDEPNPRQDKLYPFSKTGYEIIGDGQFFYYKSLVFKSQQDEKIINTLYPMVVDGTYLALFPPMYKIGQDAISSDVMIPGSVSNFKDINTKMEPLFMGGNIMQGLTTLFNVEKSINESAADNFAGQINEQGTKGGKTAYGISVMNQQANVILGLFVQMISQFVREFGKLRMGDILQYLTVADAASIGGKELVYQTFLLAGKEGESVKKMMFDGSMPDEVGNYDDKELEMSYETKKMEGDRQSLFRVNPRLYRTLKFMVGINPDIYNPMSEELEKQYGLEIYDRAISNPVIDQEKATKDFLLRFNRISRKDPDSYVKKQEQNPAMMGTPNTAGLDMQAVNGQNTNPLAQPPKLPQPAQRSANNIAM